jgi:4-hydroxy-3-polyprenylbenzoate decarboxylase
VAETDFKDLRDFITYVEKRGLLRRVRVPVSREFEIAEITNRAAHLPGGGPVLLFENVTGATMPVLTNLTGSASRLAWSLSLNSLKELEQRMLSLLYPAQPLDFGERLARLGETSHLSRYTPKVVRSGPCQAVVKQDATALELLPALRAWPDEAGATIRGLLIFSRTGPDNSQNVTAGHLLLTDKDAFLSGLSVAPGERRPVALVIGGDPALLFAARAPFLPTVDRLVLAGGLVRRRLELVRCQTTDLEVPTTAELVLEGYLEAPTDPVILNLGQANGYYSPIAAPAHFTLTALTHRLNPLFITSVVGQPPHEETALLKGSERVLVPLLRLNTPEIVDICLPQEGTGYNLLLASIRKSYPGQAQKVMCSLWGMESLRLIKNIVIVDEDCDIHDPSAVATRVLSLTDPTRDWLVAQGPLEAAPGFGAKLGLDATRKLPGEGPTSTPLQSQETIRRLVDEKWIEYGLE